jgi:eukaryotic-like serine/threonine-protein kinase
MQDTLIAHRYRLEEVIGQGGVGEVWRAHDIREDRKIAIKLIHAKLADSADARARFLREAELAARISSEHVVRILDRGVAQDGRPFIAMEYLVGTSLRDRLIEEGSLSMHDVARLLPGLSRALDEAHEAGLVHRDLKPENVFLVRVGDEQAPKILDFGVAKVIGLLDSAVPGTVTGDLRGTPCYMSPEQVQGLRNVDRKADLWALGVIVFECITGVRPFEGSGLGPLVAKILVGPTPIPSRVAPEALLNPAVDAWMLRALARDPAARFASAGELAASFERAVNSASPAPAVGDEAAIRRAFDAGDLASAATLGLRQVGPEVLRYLTGHLGDPDRAAEAFADFSGRVWSNLPDFAWRSSFRTWAYVLARRAAADLQRAQGRRERREQPLTDSLLAAVAEQIRIETLPLLRTEGQNAMARLRAELPHEDKMLFILYVERGLSWRDIARVFLAADASDTAEVERESARLRKRYQLVRERLRKRAMEMGLFDPG